MQLINNLLNDDFMQKEQPTFHPISKAPSILGITNGMLDSSKEQLVSMEKIKDKPYVLTDELIKRSIKLYTSQNEDLEIFLRQCSIWREKELSELQQYQVRAIEDNVDMITKINNQILDIVNGCKNLTIDKILEKDDFELSFEALTGKIQLPK